MHMAVWIVIAVESLATGAGRGIVVHLPRATLLHQSWLPYGAAAGGLILLLSAVYAWSERSTFGTVWKLTPGADRNLFWGELKFNVIGITFLLAVSLASISLHKWALDHLYRLPEAKFVRIVFADAQVQLSLAQSFDYFVPALPAKKADKATTDLPHREPEAGAEEQANKGNDRENDGSSSTVDPDATRSKWMRSLVFYQVFYQRRDEKIMHMIFPFHVALMTLLYAAFCRALTVRHKVMAG